MTEGNKPLGMSDFFALEAGEYLERLDGLLAQSEHPGAVELVGLARARRGSALMASQQAIARAAAGLEPLARAVNDGRPAWDAQTNQLAVRAVDDLKIFVRRAGAWTDADTAKAEALGQELDQLAGRPSAQIRAAEALGLDAGARAFVAREGAAIASALDRAAQALRANPLAHDPLQHVLRALQPLRGLAALADLPPLPDLLDGIERTIADLSRSGLGPPANVAELFQAAATAIARSARDVAERGRPDPEGVAEFAVAARDAVASGSAVGHAAAFAAELRQVGDLLVASNTGDEDALAAALAPLIEQVRSLGASGATHAPPASIPAAPRPPVATPAPRAPTEAPDLAGSWAAYERLGQARVGPPSLQGVFAIRDASPQDALPILDIRTLLVASALGPTPS